ncbi:hypothetical protein [Metabacillus iocasae]|uniref:Uncharacterized protein n=1 Tax=Priestia iocasae TaxID=2291674 RepID=A0ABS2QU15_9BACI|nr:hypothetical protein [Metabacillus iocasae]MBM7702256.1 hypothetical protein [Metabacillus iocasae]
MKVYDLGGNVYVSQSNLSTYEKLPRDIAQIRGVEVKFVDGNLPGKSDFFRYPQFPTIMNKEVQQSINAVFSKIGDEVKKQQQMMVEKNEQDPSTYHWVSLNSQIPYNFNNKLSVVVYRGAGTRKDGNSEYTFSSSQFFNFNLLTGKQIYLKDVLTTEEQIERVNQYLKKEYGYAKGIDVHRDEFYFSNFLFWHDMEYMPPDEYFGIHVLIKDSDSKNNLPVRYIPKEVYAK